MASNRLQKEINTKCVLTNQTPSSGSPLLICCHEVSLKKMRRNKFIA